MDGILVVGGDGTVGEVLNGLVDPWPPLLILRTGTANLLARELLQPRSAAGVVETLLKGDVVSVDLGLMNGRRFASILGVGFDAECVRRLSEVRCGHIGYHSYLAPIWRTFRRHRFPILHVEVDGTTLFDGPGMAFVGLIPRYAIGLRVLKHARNDDGLLDVAIFECGSRWRLLGHASRVVFRLPYGRRARYAQCRSVRITSEDANVAVQLDGDCAGYLPVEVNVLPRTVRFLIPAQRRKDRLHGEK